MKDNLCNMIHDIYPLYLDGDVSEETRQMIQEHINQCEKCSNLKNEYSASCLPKVEDATPDEKSGDSFRGVMKKIRKLALMLLAAVLVVIIIALGVGYYAGQHNRKLITYVKTEEDVIKYYYDKIPGLERGQREGCYENIARSAELPGGLGTIDFNKIWYTKDGIYVFFGITPGKSIGSMEDAQLSGNIVWNDDKELASYSILGGMDIGEWVSYNGSYYRVLAFENTKERFNPSISASIMKLSLNMTLTYAPERNNIKQVQVNAPEVSFPVMYDPVMERTYTMDINKKLSIQDDTEITFKQLIMEPQRSYLMINYLNKSGKELALLEGMLSTDKGENIHLWQSPEKMEGSSGDYRIELHAINDPPSDVKITLDELRLITDKGLKFELDSKKYHGDFSDTGKSEKVRKKIGNIGNINFTLESLYWDNRGLDFVISDNAKLSGKSGISNSSNMLNSWASEEEYRQMLAKEGKTLDRRGPNLVKFTNEKGEIGTTKDYGQRSGGSGECMDMFIGKDFVEKSNTIYVEIMNIVETITGMWKTN